MAMRNPVFWRELMGILRTPRALGLLCAIVAGLFVLIAMRWPTGSMVDLDGRRAREIFQLISCGLASGILLAAPAFPATSVVNERRSGTLALLFNSPLSRLQIYFGKLGASVSFMLLVMLATLPAAAACYAMGGVSLDGQILPLYGLLTLAIVHVTAVSLVISTLSYSPDSALRSTYGIVLLLICGSMAPFYFTRGTESWVATAADWLFRLSPLPPLLALVDLRLPTPDGMELASFTELVSRHLPVAAVSCVAWIGAGLWLLRPNLMDRSRDAGIMTDDRSTSQRVLRRLTMLGDPQRRSRGVGRFINPLLVKELRTRRFGRLSWLLRLVMLCAIISIAITLGAMKSVLDRGLGTVGVLLIGLQLVLLILVTPSLTAGLISSERESGGWRLLQMTPLSALRIVSGKLMSVMLTLFLILMATLPGYLVILAVARDKLPEVIRIVGSLLLIATYCMCVGAAVGSFFRRAATATVAAYVALLAVFAGTLLVWLGRDAPFGYDVVRTALLFNPAVAPLSLIRASDFDQYNLLPLSWYWTGAITVLAFVTLIARVWRLSRPE